MQGQHNVIAKFNKQSIQSQLSLGRPEIFEKVAKIGYDSLTVDTVF